MPKKIYDVIQKLLVMYPSLRSCDRELIWEVWKEEGYVSNANGQEWLFKHAFLKATPPETITRARRKVQEDHKDLGPSKEVKKYREERLKVGKYFVYHETI